MSKYLVHCRYDEKWHPYLLTLFSLARKVLLDGKIAGALKEYAVYRMIPGKDPVRLKAVEDYSAGSMSIKLYDSSDNLVDIVTIMGLEGCV